MTLSAKNHKNEKKLCKILQNNVRIFNEHYKKSLCYDKKVIDKQ